MYVPAAFRENDLEALHQVIRQHGFATLVTMDGGCPFATHLPLLLDAERGPYGTLLGHVARANPVWRDSRPDVDALVVFQGAQAYVSPNWYPVKAEHGKVVPTWNYIMVQARGRLRAIDDRQWLRAFVTRLTDRHESGRPAPWAVSDAPSDYVDYTVQKGDILKLIAQKYGVTVAEILAVNQIANPDSLNVGSVIHIPKK